MIITFLRSHRSTSTPAHGRGKSGSDAGARTNPTATLRRAADRGRKRGDRHQAEPITGSRTRPGRATTGRTRGSRRCATRADQAPHPPTRRVGPRRWIVAAYGSRSLERLDHPPSSLERGGPPLPFWPPTSGYFLAGFFAAAGLLRPSARPSWPGPSAWPSAGRRLLGPAAAALGRPGARRRAVRRAVRRPARWSRSSTVSPLRSDALVSPSVTYGPKRPSLTTIGLPDRGRRPISRSGAFGLALAPAALGLGQDQQRLVERDA